MTPCITVVDLLDDCVLLVFCLTHFSKQNMQAIFSSENSLHLHRITWRCIPEDRFVLKTVRLKVQTPCLTGYSVFNIDSLSKSCPVRSASGANIIWRDVGIFRTKILSLILCNNYNFF